MLDEFRILLKRGNQGYGIAPYDFQFLQTGETINLISDTKINFHLYLTST
jgi:hypothetical protein